MKRSSEDASLSSLASLVIDACLWGRTGLAALAPAPSWALPSLAGLFGLPAESPLRTCSVVILQLPRNIGSMLAELNRLALLLAGQELTAPVLVLGDLSHVGLQHLLGRLHVTACQRARVYAMPARLPVMLTAEQMRAVALGLEPAWVSGAPVLGYESRLLTLTGGELMALADALGGLSIPELISMRGRSRKTLYSHRQHALRKLGVSRLAALGGREFA